MRDNVDIGRVSRWGRGRPWAGVVICFAIGVGCATSDKSRLREAPIAERSDVADAPPPESELSPYPAGEGQPDGPLTSPDDASGDMSTPELLEQVVSDAEAPIPADAAPPITSDETARRYFEGAVAAAQTPARAMVQFEKAARRDPSFAVAWHNAGVAAERQGKLNAAVRYYHKVLERRPAYQPSLFNLVQIYRRLGRSKDADSVAKRALRNGRNASTLCVAGAAALAMGQAEDAVQYAQQSLKQDERNVTAMLVLAEAYHRQGKYELERLVLTNAGAIEPDNALVLEGLGRTFLALKNDAAARKKFEEAVALRQDLPESYVNLAALYYRVGDYAGAATASRQAVQLAPRLGAAWVNRGNALRAQRRYPEAIAAYEKAAGLRGTKAEAQFNLGILYLDNEVPKLEIIERMDRAIKHLSAFRARAKLTELDAERVEKYLTQADRLKKRELQRRERAIKRKAEEEKRKRAEAEARRKAEAEARKEAEAEARKKAEIEARKKAAEEARRRKVGGGGK